MNKVMGDAEKTKKSFVPVYKMTKQKLGQVVIFNNKEFDNGTYRSEVQQQIERQSLFFAKPQKPTYNLKQYPKLGNQINAGIS